MGWSGGSAFVIGETAYVGTGLDTTNALVNDFWQYNPANDTWTELPALPAAGRYTAVGFAIAGRGYIGTGQLALQTGAFLNDFWEYTPGCATPANLTTTNISMSSAKLKWEAVSGATKYKVQYKADSAGATWISKTIKATKTVVTIIGLTANTSYKWKVRSICGEEPSEYSPAQFFTTSLKLENENDKEIFFDVYPNPFSSHTTLSFFLEEGGHITLEAFDLTGRKIMLLDEVMEAGEHEWVLQREQIGAGIFFIRLTTGNKTSVVKVVVQ